MFLIGLSDRAVQENPGRSAACLRTFLQQQFWLRRV